MSIIEPEGKAITRSFRLDKAWNDAVIEEAEKQGISVSGLLEKIVKDYVLFYRWCEELESVIFSPNTIKGIIDSIDEEILVDIAEKVAKSTFTESYLVRGDGVNLDVASFQITQQMGKYAHWFTVSEHDTNSHYFYIKHLLGEKWSVFVEAYVRCLFTEAVGVKVTMERVGENILVKLDNS